MVVPIYMVVTFVWQIKDVLWVKLAIFKVNVRNTARAGLPRAILVPFCERRHSHAAHRGSLRNFRSQPVFLPLFTQFAISPPLRKTLAQCS